MVYLEIFFSHFFSVYFICYGYTRIRLFTPVVDILEDILGEYLPAQRLSWTNFLLIVLCLYEIKRRKFDENMGGKLQFYSS